MKGFLVLALVLAAGGYAFADTEDVAVRCQAGAHFLQATVHSSTGGAREIVYLVEGPTYAYEGFLTNDKEAQYAQSVSVSFGDVNGDMVDIEAELLKTAITDYPECILPRYGSRACGKWVYGPHPSTTVSQSFFLRMFPNADGTYRVAYFSIGGANPNYPGSYAFPDLNGASCVIQKPTAPHLD